MKTVRGFAKARLLLDRSGYLAPEVASEGKNISVEGIVSDIINQVAAQGDAALKAYSEKFDHVKLKTFKVTRREMQQAYKTVDKKLVSDLKLAAKRIERFHMACRERITFSFETNNLGRITRPLHTVGIYVPGGTAAYPSTVLMTAIPARVAGVQKVIMVSPSLRSGNLPAATLVAADIAAVDEIYKIGGAQAIAALAYGTKSIPKVDKICGPGNIFVATAKRQLFGVVDIDGIQGPSEIIIVADKTANPAFCAADLMAQSEHDEMATSILITDSIELARATEREIRTGLNRLSRKETLQHALKTNGLIVIIKNMNEAMELVNLFAPEHLLLMLRQAKKYLPKILNAGCVFIGETSPVVLGDYIAGPSHVLPTGGTARFSSPLGIESFLKTINYVALNRREQNELGPAAARLANKEGLDAHANAIKVRLRQGE
ncbi:MAG TPA: histidinol dehydrogenase [Dehalococcoidia bacterium]|nr:histidinol dehydrogenase [Dehalococcoidia bacterium]